MRGNKFVEAPNLPKGKVSLLAAGERYRSKLQPALARLGVSAVWLPDSPCVDARLAGHADLSLLHLGGNKLIAAKWLKEDAIVNQLTNNRFNITWAASDQSRDYPGDCALNICLFGKTAVINNAIAETAAISEISDYHIVPVRQGYAKCSVCVVSENAIITSDIGIASALCSTNADVLLIGSRGVLLEGYENGFIGGATFKLAQNKLAFTGTIDQHPDCDRILAFLDKHKIQPLFLTDSPVFDIGGGIPILEF